MVEILAFAFGIMYTPGPVNLLSLSAGLNGHIYSTLRFCAGVGCAMLVLLLIFGYGGSLLINKEYQLIISILGSLYIFYLAVKILLVSFKTNQTNTTSNQLLNFKAGFMMQLLNPKALVVILPIVTVQFPALQISGSAIITWSILLASMAFGAPSSYLIIGSRLGKFIHIPRYFGLFNLTMGLVLLYVAGDIAYHHVYLQWPV